MPLEAKNIYFRYDRKQPWILEDCSVPKLYSMSH